MRNLFKMLLGVLLIRRIMTGYIDPNTGGMLFQFLAVAFALLSTVFLFFSGQIKALFARLRRSARERGIEDDETSGDEPADDI